MQVVIYLRSELNKRGLTSTLVSASDENTYDIATSTWNSFNSTARANIGRINVHGYQDTGGRRDLLYSAASSAGLEIWNSEYGESDATGLSLAQDLLLDFSWLHPRAWVYWQAIDGGGWGLITGDITSGQLSGVANKYYVLAHFTRHIREGMRILNTGSLSDTVAAAYDAANRKLIIVAANFGSGQYINFDLSKFSQLPSNGALVPSWSTHTNGSEQYVAHSDTYISGTKFWSYFDQNVVQTFEVDNISL